MLPRSPRRPGRPSRSGSRVPGARRPGARLSRAVAAVAVTAVIAGGAVVIEQPQPAQAASWSGAGTATTWISGMNSALGNVGKLLGREFTGASLFLDILGPTISSIFGGDTGPGIQDVLDRLQQLDDIERKLD